MASKKKVEQKPKDFQPQDFSSGELDNFFNTWPITKERLSFLQALTVDSPEDFSNTLAIMDLGDRIWKAIEGHRFS